VSIETREIEGQTVHRLGKPGEPLGYVVVDSHVGGCARGGLRLVPDLCEEELRRAARSMTLKYGFLGLPQGGAKAGVCGDGDGSSSLRRERLLAFAREAEPLLRRRVYVPDADLGTRSEDIRWLLQQVGIPVRRREWRESRSGLYTAVSCLAAAEAALAHRGRGLPGCRVAIEGVGSVGSALARRLHRRGAAIVAISTSRGALHHPDGLDVARLLRLAAEAGSRVVERYPEADALPREALLELPVDVLAPCARHHSVHAGNARRIAAPIVCPGANNPVTRDAEGILHERGTLLVPDFLANCGGVLGGTLEFAAVAPARIEPLVEAALAPRIRRLLDAAEERGVAPAALAEPLALARHARMRAAQARPGLRGRLLSLGLSGYRRGWVPRVLVGALSPAYVAALLETPPASPGR